ncbi:MAG: YceI family protein [Chitinophagales bacterium]
MRIASTLIGIFIMCCTPIGSFAQNQNNLRQINSGTIYFKSDAPLELIEAQSKSLKGIIDTKQRTFAYTVSIESFEGFNSPLQREHFNENYMETNLFPKATFSGKIIENVDFESDGVYEVRAKGKLNIHGVEQERIIKATLQINGGQMEVHSKFTVPLTDHNITIPRIVEQKIATEIYVEINAQFEN